MCYCTLAFLCTQSAHKKRRVTQNAGAVLSEGESDRVSDGEVDRPPPKVDTSFTFMCIVDNIRILGW